MVFSVSGDLFMDSSVSCGLFIQQKGLSLVTNSTRRSAGYGGCLTLFDSDSGKFAICFSNCLWSQDRAPFLPRFRMYCMVKVPTTRLISGITISSSRIQLGSLPVFFSSRR